jgi:hypothetical protein
MLPSVHTLTSEQHRNCNGDVCKLHKLGILLAEVILATPLRGIMDNDGHLVYEEGEKNSENWFEISREKILEKFDDKSKSVDLVDAVKFCLDYSPTYTTDTLHHQFLVGCIELVFKW